MKEEHSTIISTIILLLISFVFCMEYNLIDYIVVRLKIRQLAQSESFKNLISDGNTLTACSQFKKFLKVGMRRWEVELIAKYDDGGLGGEVIYFPDTKGPEEKTCKLSLNYRYIDKNNLQKSYKDSLVSIELKEYGFLIGD